MLSGSCPSTRRRPAGLLSAVNPIISGEGSSPLWCQLTERSQSLLSKPLCTWDRRQRAGGRSDAGHGGQRRGDQGAICERGWAALPLAVSACARPWNPDPDTPHGAQVGEEVLGMAAKVEVSKEATTIVGDGRSEEAVKARVKQIKNLIAETEQDYEREKLNERVARLSGGVAIIQVGAQTETELKEKKLRVEDALNATKARAPGNPRALIPMHAARRETCAPATQLMSNCCAGGDAV